MTLFACEQNALSPEATQLVSPNGYVLANDSDELRSLLNISPESKIDAIDYFESKEANLALVTYTDENGKESTIAIGSGVFSYNADLLDVQPALKSAGGKVKVTCSGCDNCRVQGSIYPDGTVSVSCESSCCTMTIEGATELKSADNQ